MLHQTAHGKLQSHLQANKKLLLEPMRVLPGIQVCITVFKTGYG